MPAKPAPRTHGQQPTFATLLRKRPPDRPVPPVPRVPAYFPEINLPQQIDLVCAESSEQADARRSGDADPGVLPRVACAQEV